jgi:hypothetical protein
VDSSTSSPNQIDGGVDAGQPGQPLTLYVENFALQ